MVVDSDKAWRAIAAIGGLDRWFPIISSCLVEGAGVGAIRIMTLIDGGEIRDGVLEIDSATKRFPYERTHSPFPVSQYFGAVEVKEKSGPTCEVSWTLQIEVSDGDREQLSALLKQTLNDGVSGLERDFGRASAPPQASLNICNKRKVPRCP